MKMNIKGTFLTGRPLASSRLAPCGRRGRPGSGTPPFRVCGGGSPAAELSAPPTPLSRWAMSPAPFNPASVARRFTSSVSSREVEKFSALDDEWWDPLRNPLIHMNAVRMKYIRAMVAQHQTAQGLTLSGSGDGTRPFQGLRALDIGCGGGLASESLARLGAAVTGIDPSPRLVHAAQAHSQLDERTRLIDYRVGCTAEELARERAAGTIEAFDLICLLEVIEHATDAPSLLWATSELLKPSGLLFLSTINRTVKSYFLTIVGAEYVMRYIPVGTHDWSKYLSPEEVKSLADMTRLQPMDVTGMVLSKPPLLGSWDWELSRHDLDVNWIGTYNKVSEDTGGQRL